jgi:hypothetical protein
MTRSKKLFLGLVFLLLIGLVNALPPTPPPGACKLVTVGIAPSTVANKDVQVWLKNWTVGGGWENTYFWDNEILPMHKTFSNDTDASFSVNVPEVSSTNTVGFLTCYNDTIYIRDDIMGTFNAGEDFNAIAINTTAWANPLGMWAQGGGILYTTENPDIQGLQKLDSTGSLVGQMIYARTNILTSDHYPSFSIYYSDASHDRDNNAVRFTCQALTAWGWDFNCGLGQNASADDWVKSAPGSYQANTWYRIGITIVNDTTAYMFMGETFNYSNPAIVAYNPEGGMTTSGYLTLGSWGVGDLREFDEVYIGKTFFPNPEPTVTVSEITASTTTTTTLENAAAYLPPIHLKGGKIVQATPPANQPIQTSQGFWEGLLQWFENLFK